MNKNEINTQARVAKIKIFCIVEKHIAHRNFTSRCKIVK